LPGGAECGSPPAPQERGIRCRRSRNGPEPTRYARDLPCAIALLDTILGVDQCGAERWVAETGIDRGHFGPPAHLQDLGAYYFDVQRQHHLFDRLMRRIERLGYRVRLEPVPAG
jgi:hypothetical protein